MRTRSKPGRIGLLALLPALLAVAFAAPRVQAALVTKTAVERQAEQAFEQMKARLPAAPDAEARALVDCVARSIIGQLDEPYRSMEWEIELFEHPSANAFALPGGKIGVLTGIFTVTDGQDSLAAVLGHEVAHVVSEHSLKRARRTTRNQLLVIAATEALGVGRRTSNVLGLGAQIGLDLPYDRKQETEADSEGLRLMSRAGFDPRASLTLWKNMSRQGGGSPPAFLSTHPSPDNRIDRLIRQLASSLTLFNEARGQGRIPRCEAAAD